MIGHGDVVRICFRLFPILIAASGCATPEVYQGEALPRHLVDPPLAPVKENYPPNPPEVPVNLRPTLTLPEAVSECVLNNLRVKAGVERIKFAQADYVTESLIPNCQLMADGQLLPITSVSPVNQAGPPQYDMYLTMPIDWILFGKQVASKAAAKLNIDVAQAEYADVMRREIDQTVDAFYVALEADVALTMAQQTVESLAELERTAKARAKEDEKAKVEVGRVRLAVLDAQRALRRARAAADTTKTQLRTRIGRAPDAPDFVVKGVLTVKAAAPSVPLQRAWDGALQNRPDIIAARRAVEAAEAGVKREKARAYPQVSLMAGVDYQDQVAITGFRNAWFYTLSAATTLPFTDRNQGRIMAAEAGVRAARANLAALVAEMHAEVDQAIAEYEEALGGVTGEDVDSLKTAREVWEQTLSAYRKGDKDLIDALDAERAYRDRLRGNLGNLTDYWQALNRLNSAVGLRLLSATPADGDKLLGDKTPPLNQKK